MTSETGSGPWRHATEPDTETNQVRPNHDGRREPARAIRQQPDLQPARIQVVNWIDLTPDAARAHWQRLDRWVTQLRRDYGLPPNIIPPLWHRHWELVWELSALHAFWLNAYGPGAQATSPLMFQRYFAESRTRLRDWVATCGTKLDTDRPTRQTAWPGEDPHLTAAERPIVDRQADFEAFVAADVAQRRARTAADALTLLIHRGGFAADAADGAS
ncbi:hypothetical protein [Pengzhenrongella sicca]|nr:hypothetical protein [Pengzhenrongella sicca]